MQHLCEDPPWHLAPVIVGGSGGSGTRGVVMLLEELGVRMACIGSASSSLADPRVCDLPCNDAADCALINSFKGPDLSWMRDNFTRVLGHSTCHDFDMDALTRSANSSRPDLCGGSKAAAIQRLQKAVRPEYRRPLRWGLKNPHSTYYVNVLRTYFPCMVYVNTVRDLRDMVRTGKHFSSRVNEAMRFGVLTEDEGATLHEFEEVQRRRHSTTIESTGFAAMQQFYGQYVKSVNVALVTWTERCLHGRVAHVPLQRMVAKAPHAHSDADCVLVVARSLSAVLRLDEVFAINVTRAFANASFPLVSKSLYEASLLPLAEGRIDHELSSPRGGWPEGSLLLPHACAGAIYVKPREH